MTRTSGTWCSARCRCTRRPSGSGSWSRPARDGPVGSGCVVTETWTDRRSPLLARVAELVTGTRDRPELTVRSLERTLAAGEAAAEG